jgi:DNA-binding transcriptional regulator YdaS (Cro superfamily)
MDDAIERAKRIAGNTAKLARLLGGISSQAISQWKRVPAERVLDVERVTGIPRHELRPDIYPILGGEAAATGAGGEAGGVSASPPANVDTACRVRDA